MAEVLLYLKNKSILHRDIKPENILVANVSFFLITTRDNSNSLILASQCTLPLNAAKLSAELSNTCLQKCLEIGSTAMLSIIGV